MHRALSIACLLAVTGLACSDSQTGPPLDQADSATINDAGPAKNGAERTDGLPAIDNRSQDRAEATATADGNAGDVVSISVTQVASTADLDAYYKAWCDWDVRCSSSFPTSICDERRKSGVSPEQYASQPLAIATACWPTLSCDGYAEDCVQAAALATAQSVPSRADLYGACAIRADECTGEGQLQLMDCYFFMLLSESMQPKVEACMALPCNQYRTCVIGLRQ